MEVIGSGGLVHGRRERPTGKHLSHPTAQIGRALVVLIAHPIYVLQVQGKSS